MNISDLEFVDCLLTDFSISPNLEIIYIKCEAYFPTIVDGSMRTRQLASVTLTGCTSLRINTKPEFWRDLKREYTEADTTKANEIIYCKENMISDGLREFELDSDMLRLQIECKAVLVV